MQPLVILLIAAVVIAADAGLSAEDALVPRGDWTRLAVAVVPVVAAVGVLQLLVQWRLGPRTDPTRPASIMALERASRWVRWFLLAHYAAAVLLFGWLDAVRSFVGNPILVDEVIAMLPVLAGLTAIWWAYWPVERRIRDAVLVRRLDEGGPVFPGLGRGAYVLLQLRIQVLLLLVPILLILGLSEAIGALGGILDLDPARGWVLDVATFAAAGLVFALAPLLARVLLTVEPLGPGPLRDDLEACCRRHGVRVRRLYVWHTGGSMINAAVMGLVAPLRCVLMTDALLETLPRPHLLAVMAHEIGHVRRHHMPWLVVGLLATLAASVLLVNGTAAALGAAGLPVAAGARWFDATATVVEAVVALVAFGWICRRFERQADCFAVQHLSGLAAESGGGPTGPPRVDVASVETVRGALGAIARLNAVDPERRSWRHGSIEWRRAYLSGLVDRPLWPLPIDRLVQRIKIASVAVLAGAAVLVAALEPSPTPGGEPVPEHAETPA